MVTEGLHPGSLDGSETHDLDLSLSHPFQAAGIAWTEALLQNYNFMSLDYYD